MIILDKRILTKSSNVATACDRFI